jgi:DNA-binding response OmpR family regulator
MSLQAALVDADSDSAKTLSSILESQDCRVSHYRSLGRFLDGMARRRPDLVLLDMDLPGIAGRELLRALRSDPANKGMIVIGFSNRRGREEVVGAFTAGADEYLTKPVDGQLLAVRLQSLLRRSSKPAPEPSFSHKGISVLPESRLCRIQGKAVRLTRLEFDILLTFMQNTNRVLTRGNLIDALWHGQGGRGARAVDRHVHALRVKLGVEGRALRTLVGIGYCLGDGAKGSSK